MTKPASDIVSGYLFGYGQVFGVPSELWVLQ